MTEDQNASLAKDTGYVEVSRDLDMDRSAPPSPVPRTNLGEDEDEDRQPVLSELFATEQLQQGLNNASAFFSFAFSTIQTNLKEGEEKARELFESTKPQRDALAGNANRLGQEITSLAEQVKTEGARAWDQFVTGNKPGNAGGEQQ